MQEESPMSALEDDETFNSIINRTFKRMNDPRKHHSLKLNVTPFSAKSWAANANADVKEISDGVNIVQPSLQRNELANQNYNFDFMVPKSALPTKSNSLFSARKQKISIHYIYSLLVEPSTPQLSSMDIENEPMSACLKNENMFQTGDCVAATSVKLPTIINNKNGNVATISHHTVNNT